jgi:hypothetical protein
VRKRADKQTNERTLYVLLARLAGCVRDVSACGTWDVTLSAECGGQPLKGTGELRAVTVPVEAHAPGQPEPTHRPALRPAGLELGRGADAVPTNVPEDRSVGSKMISPYHTHDYQPKRCVRITLVRR